MKLLGMLCAMTLASSLAYAGQIQGKVTNAQGAAVAGATVTVIGDGASTSKITTGADGSFSVPDVQPGTYTVTVSTANAQQTMRQQVKVGSEGAAKTDFKLPAAAAASAQDVSGLEERNPNIFIYRIDLNDLRNQLTLFRGPTPTYVPEFRAEQNYYGAEYGTPLLLFQPPAQRPLLRDWHTTLYALHQNSKLNARNFFNVGPLYASRLTNYNIAAGGSLTKKASILLNFGQTFNSGYVNGNVQVPRLNERTPLTDNTQEQAIISSLLTAYRSVPNYNNGTRQSNTNAPRSVKDTSGLSRLDFKPSDKESISARYFADEYNEDPFQLVTGQNPQTDLRSQGAYFDMTRAFTKTTLGQFGFHYDRVRASLTPTKEFQDLLSGFGLTSMPDIQFGNSNSSSTDLFNIGPGVQFPRFRVQNNFTMFGNLSHTYGRHNVKFGAISTRTQVNDLQSNNSRGSILFQPDETHTAVQNFLLGRFESFSITIGHLYRGFRNWQHAAFVDDNFRVTPTFNVSMGLRFEADTSPTEVDKLTNPGVPFQYGFAPRFGIAWNPNRGKTTVRAAYGLNYSSIFPVTYQITRFNPPAVQVITLSGGSTSLTDALNLIKAAPSLSPVPGARTELYRISPDLVRPYAHMYSLSIEHALPWQSTMRIAYMGSRTFHLLSQQVYNRAIPVAGIPTTTATVNQRRPDQRYYAINQVESNSIDYYDALQVSMDKRISKGLTFRAAYTFSKNINLGGDFTNTASGVEVPPETGTPGCENCDHFKDQKGVALFDTPQVLSISYSYRLPFFANSNNIGATLFKGWQVSGTTLYQSGIAIHFHTGADAPGVGNVDGTGQDRPNLIDPSVLGLSIDNPDTSLAMLGGGCLAPTATIPYYHCPSFDTNLPASGRGTLGMNTFRKDGTHNHNVAIGRTFRLPGGERSVEFRSEFLNLFNTPQFDKPGVNVSNGTFGKIVNTVNKGRQVQFSLKLSF